MTGLDLASLWEEHCRQTLGIFGCLHSTKPLDEVELDTG